MLTALCALAMMEEPKDMKTWGLETAERIRTEYRLPRRALYADSLDASGKRSGPAFNWGVGVWMTALNGAAKADPKWREELKSFVYATRVYWNPKGPVAGYDVLPGPKDVDRYYDDNQWMVMALVDASDILGDPKVLGWAEDTLKYVLSGEDSQLGGGIYWQEAKKTSKNACSNGPAAAACLAVYGKIRKPEYLLKARELYAWTKKHLQDPSDGLFWDNINLRGRVDRKKWSYNTALMIRSAAELARFTGDHKYADDAEWMAASSEKHWVDPQTGAIRDGGRFAHLLLESWAFVPTPERKEATLRALRWVHDNGRDAKGRYGGQFNAPPKPGQAKFELIDQASAARAFLSAAR